MISQTIIWKLQRKLYYYNTGKATVPQYYLPIQERYKWISKKEIALLSTIEDLKDFSSKALLVFFYKNFLLK